MRDWRKSPNLGFTDLDIGRSDCEIIKEDAEDLIGSIGECLETVVSKHTTKIDVVEGMFDIGKNLLKLGFDGTVCAVKNTPKAIATVADAKRKLIDAGTEEYYKIKKEMDEEALEKKISEMKDKYKIERD
jgi:hypothetical protein